MFDTTELRQFLVEAKRATYAAGDEAAKTVEADHSTTITFERGDWTYHDNYFGGEPYGGREVVFFKEKPVYIMTYYGTVDESISDFSAVYGVLMHALKRIPIDHPYRGPEKFDEGDLSYVNTFKGTVEDFSGEESISDQGKVVYRAKYMGGFVDVRK